MDPEEDRRGRSSCLPNLPIPSSLHGSRDRVSRVSSPTGGVRGDSRTQGGETRGGTETDLTTVPDPNLQKRVHDPPTEVPRWDR